MAVNPVGFTASELIQFIMMQDLALKSIVQLLIEKGLIDKADLEKRINDQLEAVKKEAEKPKITLL